MSDDWRLRIELGEEAARGLLGRLGVVRNDADELAKELEHERLAVTHDEDTVFVYAGNAGAARPRRAADRGELGVLGLTAVETAQEHWLADEDRWDDEPAERARSRRRRPPRATRLGGADPLRVASRGAGARRSARGGGLRRRHDAGRT